ncbi:hypothetical protein EV192_11242 [Actinocrispum wychmicini]|uniref:Uncharacterized protein n=2 Tax=Actinocrispum wychmicini TaxID=1213861 RepID=A0A4R2J238_9PSEU|nr:hypothetical protein EV192_11242 [Actinocrispum wychmicini]
MLGFSAQHSHILTVPINIGPLVLRIAFLVAVPVVAGFAMLRAYMPPTGRTATAAIAATAAVSVVLTLMLTDGVDVPAQVVVLLLAASAGPLFVILSRDERFAAAVRRASALAPWPVSVAAGFAFTEFARGWLTGGRDAAAIVYTGTVFALVSLSWFTVCRPRGRWLRVLLQIEAAVLAVAMVGGAAHATVLRQTDPNVALTLMSSIEDGQGRPTVTPKSLRGSGGRRDSLVLPV